MDAPAPPIALLLDIDGTIVDFEPHPDAVVLDRAFIGLLGELARALSGAIGMVSGRPISAIDRLLHPMALPAVGLHGAQYRTGAAASVHVLAASLPADVRVAIHAIGKQHAVSLVEDKDGIAIALHLAVEPVASSDMEVALGALLAARAPQWTLFRGRRVLEIKPRAHSKGTGCVHLMREALFRGRMPVYLGDDITDLDAFDAMRELGGINIAVGPRIAHAADIALETPTIARAWLTQLSRWVLGEAQVPHPLLIRDRTRSAQ